MLARGIKTIREPYYHGFAAQVAFFYMLSLVPISILLAQMLGAIFKDTINDSLGWLVEGINGTFSGVFLNLLTYQSAGAFNIVFLVIALWAASRGQFALTRIINYTLTDGRYTDRGFFKERIRSLMTMFLMLLSIVVAVVIMVYGGGLLQLLMPKQEFWLLLRWPIALVLFALVISVVYYVVPMERPRYRDVLAGSLFAAVGLVLVTWLYSRYLTSVATYDILYGTLANLVAMMFWFYFLAWVICLGVLLNKELMDTRGGRGGSALE